MNERLLEELDNISEATTKIWISMEALKQSKELFLKEQANIKPESRMFFIATLALIDVLTQPKLLGVAYDLDKFIGGDIGIDALQKYGIS